MTESKLTREEAVEIAESGWWKESTDQEIVAFQLFEPRLCMSFGRFHEAIEKVLDRPVFTHEFALTDQLQAEYMTERPPMSLGEGLSRLQDKFPHLKTIAVHVGKDNG